MNECTKPNCDCYDKEVERLGGELPKYGYPCLSKPEPEVLKQRKPVEGEVGAESKGERFKRPTDKQIVNAAIIFNEGKIDHDKLSDMVALVDWVVDRLYENGDVTIPSSKENES